MEKTVKTPKGQFLIRTYRPEDEDRVLSLWNAAFGKKMKPEIWRWKYLENPYGFQIMLCVSEDEIPVSMYAGIPYPFWWKDREVQITHLMDNMSHPAYRGVLGGRSGLFIRTANAFFEHFMGPQGSILMYGFPGRKHLLLGKRVFEYSAFNYGVSFLEAKTRIFERKFHPFSGKAEQILSLESLSPGLFNKIMENYPFAIRRDASFIRWRFFDHPDNNYEIWGYRSYFGKTIKAYVVCSLEGVTARIIDMIAPPSGSLIQNFMGQIGALLADRGIEKIETWLPANHFLTKGVISSGFSPGTEPLGFIPTARSFDPDLTIKWSSENIFYTMADGDLF